MSLGRDFNVYIGLFVAVIFTFFLCGCCGGDDVAWDTSHWPERDEFENFRQVKQLGEILTLSAEVRIGREVEGAPDPPEGKLLVRYEIEIANISGQTLSNTTVHLRADDALLEFYPHLDWGVNSWDFPGQPVGYVLKCGRSIIVPDPKENEEITGDDVLDAVVTPIWMELEFNGMHYFVFISPEDVAYRWDSG